MAFMIKLCVKTEKYQRILRFTNINKLNKQYY